ncbi:MAG: hypothetical protein LBV20_05425 [Treponema sp.]|jgi:hypothetical protein|nr:hypothetical protein [Treponema sp.]
MLQFYFLSILCNAVAGFVLFKNEEYPVSDDPGFKFSIHNETFRLGFGVLTCLTALLKILSVVPGDIWVIGDIIPALAGLIAGFILVFAYYRHHSDIESEKSAQLESFFESNRKWIGIVAMASAVLHFLFPAVMLL